MTVESKAEENPSPVATPSSPTRSSPCCRGRGAIVLSCMVLSMSNAGYAPQMNQFSFEFNAPCDPNSLDASISVEKDGNTPLVAGGASPAPRKRRGGVKDTQPLETMAQRLAQHPDFRVLRRLVPIMDFGAQTEGAVDVRRVLVLDTETTGLSHPSDKIIELAMLLVDVNGSTGLPCGPVHVFEGFEDPGMSIPPMAKKITGITDAMVADQRLDDGAVEALLARADCVVAHNAGFDRSFVEARFPAFASKAWACSFKDIDWKAAGADSSKLSALAADQGWFYDAHRAQMDCHALLQILTREVGTTGSNGLSLLIRAASKISFKLNATGAPFDTKDLLKARGYRWDAEAKVWGCLLPNEIALEEELIWLVQAVYGGRSAYVEVESLDGLVRFSGRRGAVSQRRV